MRLGAWHANRRFHSHLSETLATPFLPVVSQGVPPTGLEAQSSMISFSFPSAREFTLPS